MKQTLKALAQVVAVTALLTVTTHATTQDTARLQQTWRNTISQMPTPGEGCFRASYPILVWREVGCVKAPPSEFAYLHKMGAGRASGSDADYAAKTKRLISLAIGSFPEVKNLKSEQGPGGANDYSLQLNSNLILKDKSCAGTGTPQSCEGWVQFVFLNLYGNAFMQYWLHYYNATCPVGWNAFPNSGDCWKNSTLVAVPEQSITQLPYMSMRGLAIAKGKDTLYFTTQTEAYSTTGKDTVMHLAHNWHQVEFNVFGSGGAEAFFNGGASVTDKIELTDGSTNAPNCTGQGGFTFETNNLARKKCKSVASGPPYVEFREVAPR